MIKDPLLQSLYGHWVDARGKRIVPFRSMIDLSRVSPILANLFIFDFDQATEQYHCRLAGEKIQQAYKSVLSGRRSDEIFDTDINALYTGYWDTIRIHPAIAHGVGHKSIVTGSKSFELLILPLSNADNEVIQILMAQVFDFDLEQEAMDFNVDEISFDVTGCRDI